MTSKETNDAPTTYQAMEAMFNLRNVSNSAHHLIPYLKPGIKFLDLGCGLGSITLDVAKNYLPNDTIHATDFNPDYVTRSKAKASDEGISNIEFSIGDATNLSQFKDDEFDLIHAHQVLLHIPDPVSACRELRRVLRPDGVFCARDYASIMYVPPSPLLERLCAIRDATLLSHGAHPGGGRESHVWANEGGFEWEKIETAVAAVEHSGPDRMRAYQNLPNSLSPGAVKAGVSTTEEMEKIQKEFDEWSVSPAGRVLDLDGVIICRK